MITVPPGVVTLSDRRARRSRTVEVQGYQLAAHPVTCVLYAQTIGETAPAARLPVVGVS